MNKKYNIIFMGTPEFSLPSLHKINEIHNIKAIFTRAPKKTGRGQKHIITPVNRSAINLKIPCFRPKTLRDNAILNTINDFRCDLIIVVAYGLKLPEAILNTPKFGCINAHASLLPKWRGAAPIQRSLEAGDKITGVSTMLMQEEMDSGPIYDQIKIKILPSMNFKDVHDKLSFTAAKVLIKTVKELENKNKKPKIQNLNYVTFAKKVDGSDKILDLNLDAKILVRKILAFSSIPGCFINTKDGRMKIFSAKQFNFEGSNLQRISNPGYFIGKSENNEIILSCGKNSAIIIHTIQLENKKVMPSHQFLNGSRWIIGEKIVNDEIKK